MTPAEHLDKLMEECRVYIEWYTPLWSHPLLVMTINAFPAGARARWREIQNMYDVFGLTDPKLDEASRLVTECERLQKGEGE